MNEVHAVGRDRIRAFACIFQDAFHHAIRKK
jgi:hypothetical protein